MRTFVGCVALIMLLGFWWEIHNIIIHSEEDCLIFRIKSSLYNSIYFVLIK